MTLRSGPGIYASPGEQGICFDFYNIIILKYKYNANINLTDIYIEKIGSQKSLSDGRDGGF